VITVTEYNVKARVERAYGDVEDGGDGAVCYFKLVSFKGSKVTPGEVTARLVSYRSSIADTVREIEHELEDWKGKQAEAQALTFDSLHAQFLANRGTQNVQQIHNLKEEVAYHELRAEKLRLDLERCMEESP
jgi:hypothetical protein